jgi:hypothetical protein
MSFVSSLRRVAVLASVGALAITSAPAAHAASQIDTYSTWSGTSYLGSFGHPDTATYGQVITIPRGDKSVKNVTWYMAGGGSGTLTVRTEVYSWDGSKAVKEVAESKPKVIDTATTEMTGYKFKLKKAKVKAGKQYVLFATISKDYEEATPAAITTWPVHTADVLAGGHTVWINDSGDESRWTTEAWAGIPTYDMAFKATLG